ncbi:MAG: 23S rRNA (guanosine(2251)-2'-O)-methyltransferase RlmB [Solirubrobacterales bacterium]
MADGVLAHDVIYGRHAVEEAQRGRRQVLRVLTREDVSDEELERRCGSPDHQGVIAEVEPYPYADPTTLLADERALVLVLDRVQDPRNLGAICRSAEVAGASGVVIPERHSASITAAACKASAGAVEHLPVARVRNLSDWLAGAKRDGAWVYGADASAETAHDSPDYEGRVVLVLGGEERGLRPRVADNCDVLVSISQRGRIASLNVGAAAAVLLFAASRVAEKGRGG